MTKRAVWASPLFWHVATRVSSHHYAKALVDAGWKVAFLTYPVSPLHLLSRKIRIESRARFANWWQGGESDLDGDLAFYCPLTLTPHGDAFGLRSTWTLRWWQKFTAPNVLGWLRKRGFDQPDLLFVDSPAYSFLVEDLRPKKSIARVVDLTSGFRGVTKAMVEEEERLIGKVDHVVYTAHALKEVVERHHPRSMSLVAAGVDAKFFNGEQRQCPVELASIERPIAIYVGAIDHWFAASMLADVAKLRPEVVFVLIGPPRIDLGELARLENVRILGARNYKEIPAYLQHSDLGIIPFIPCPLVDAVCPIKLFEYMSCGLPVVATRWKELESMQTPARLCSDAHEFAAGVRSALRASEADRDEYRRFAAAASWEARFKDMMEMIGMDEERDARSR